MRLADSWRIGVVFYALLSGAFPFLTAREAALPAMQQLHVMVQRIVSSRPLPLIRAVRSSYSESGSIHGCELRCMR